MSTTAASRFSWALRIASVIVIFLILHGSATAWGSFRGEAGLAVGALVVVACLIAQRAFASASLLEAARLLGLGRPTARSLAIAAGVGLVLVLVLPAIAALTRTQATFRSDGLALLPGLFAQGGVAEEILFRGYLFGNLRRRHAFWRAAVLSAGPFVAAHLLMFATMSWPVALAATALALVTSFPLARLFELGGRTIWAPAIVHFVIQGAVKVVEMPGAAMLYPMMWLAACAVAPWIVFAFRVPADSQRANAT